MPRINLSIFAKSPTWLWIIVLVYTPITSGAILLKYYFGLYNGLDLAIFNHTLFQTIQGTIFGSSINPPSYIGDHFTPLLLLLTPFYKLFPHPITLLFAQTLFIASSAIPLFHIAKKHLSEKWTMLLVTSWLASPYIGSLNLFEFHIISIIPLLFLSLWYFFETNKHWAFLVTLVLTLLVREDVGITLFGLSIVMLLYAKKQNLSYKYGFIALISGLVWTPIALKIVGSFALENSYKFYAYYGWLGDEPFEIIKNVISSPLLIISHILSLDTLGLLFILLLPVLYLVLLAPTFLFAGLPPLLLLLITTEGGTPLIPFLHYNAWFLPAIYLALLFAIVRIRKKSQKGFLLLLHKNQTPLKFLLGIAIIYFFIALNPVTYTYFAAISNWKELSQDRQAKQAILTRVTPTDEVVTTAGFLTELSGRENVHYLRYLFSNRYQLSETEYVFPDEADVILFRPSDLMYYDFLTTSLTPDLKDDGAKLDEYIRTHEYSPLLITNDYILFKPRANTFLDYHKQVDELPASVIKNTSIPQEGKLTIHGWQSIRPTEEYALATLYMSTNDTVSESILLKIELRNETSIMETIIIPLSLGLVTTDRWNPNTLYASRVLIPLHDVDSEAITNITVTPVTANATYSLDRYASGKFILDSVTDIGMMTIIPVTVPLDK